jgi:hypothetical protein
MKPVDLREIQPFNLRFNAVVSHGVWHQINADLCHSVWSASWRGVRNMVDRALDE